MKLSKRDIFPEGQNNTLLKDGFFHWMIRVNWISYTIENAVGIFWDKVNWLIPKEPNWKTPNEHIEWKDNCSCNKCVFERGK